MDFELAWDARCETGESCVWDAAAGRVWFCDIPKGILHALHIGSGDRQTFQLAEAVGSFALCASGELLVALRHQLVLFDPAQGTTRPFADLPESNPHTRLNDGKTGPDGCFWVGTVDERATKEDIGVLYRVRPDGRVEKKTEGFKASNGLAWSPDGRTMYHSDSRGPWIDAWDFDARHGTLSAQRRLVTLTAEEGRPDGAACDADGNYWSAGVSAGCLNCFSPTGALLRKVPVPVSAPTMPCFVDGALYLTSLSAGLPPERAGHPHAGSLFRAATQIRGVPISLFDPI
ncbi:SMP-30/gluconolactonase/LRE family protein [Hydrogenophaga sp.]|uniref:SMP-30/gluconolactonase/LRE family protein n=1 Tax=Hydrogenophaga sp. TaxID=1904254 RepID=UPI00271BAB49|nr:SMP-30/gluconolactonase/LRE family protein [Hydrogenophaga sp.]MDO9435746.1 SMP-30/gluconolactonase/LRE family protein [Hydrogenophaga sp.]